MAVLAVFPVKTPETSPYLRWVQEEEGRGWVHFLGGGRGASGTRLFPHPTSEVGGKSVKALLLLLLCCMVRQQGWIIGLGVSFGRL